MPKKAYIINFDRGGVSDTFDYIKFHDTLTTARGIDSWWHYLESSYIVITDSAISATSISTFVMNKMANKYFIVVELNLRNHNGWLPQEAWDWINKHI